MSWGFYGRSAELTRLRDILGRNPWFFVKVTGRRRIGKTSLIQQALHGDRRVFYVQVPDSGPVGVLSAFADAMDTFEIPSAKFTRPSMLAELARSDGALARGLERGEGRDCAASRRAGSRGDRGARLRRGGSGGPHEGSVPRPRREAAGAARRVKAD